MRFVFALMVAFAALYGSAQQTRAGLYAPESFVLGNGMQVVTVTDRRAPVVVHMVWYKVGSIDEPPGKSGIAHLLEHLMFKGTDKLAPGEFSKIVAANGGVDNAFTSHDSTGYFQTIARDRLALVMGMEADRMINLRIDPDELVVERDVVLAERRQRVDARPQGQLAEQAAATLFLAHPYRIPVIGWRDEVRNLELADAMAFYRRFYAPNNAILVVAGDIDAAELRPLAEKYYGGIPANPALQPSPVRLEPPPLAARRLSYSDPRVAEPFWQRIYLADSVNWGAGENVPALQALSEILGAGAAGRLYRNLAVKRRTALDVGAWYSGVRRGPGRFGLYAAPGPDVSMTRLEAEIDAEIARIVKEGVSEAELARAKTVLLADDVYARDDLGRGARLFGGALTVGMSIGEVEGWRDRLRAVSADDVQRAAKAVFRLERSVTTMLLPEEDT